MTESAKEHHQEDSFWTSPKRIFGTTNAREIGLLYFVVAFINAAIAGTYALIIRTELWTPVADVLGDSTAADAYNVSFTLHGTGMIFLVIVPLGAGFGNYLIPRMVAADNNDMYWPKWNNVAFWMLPIGSFFIWFSQAAIGWTAYPPLSTIVSGVDIWIVGLVFAGTSSSIGGINFILTIWKGKAPYVKWMQMDLFVWAILFTSFLVLLATPVLTSALVMILLDRNFGFHFFSRSLSSPTIYQHIFWFYSHPAVYIMVLPAFGLISSIIAKFSRNKVFGYTSMVTAMAAITVLSFSVWAHHMYTTGIDPFVRVFFTSMTFIIAVPSGIKVFNWLTTLYGGRLKLEVPLKFGLAFIIMFTLGGITGVYVNIISLDVNLHDSYWVVGHFHFVVAAGSLVALFAALYYYFPDMTGGKMYDKLYANLHFWFWIVGNTITFTAFQILGMEGMPRRYFTYPERFQTWHQVATIGAFLMGMSFIFFLLSIYKGLRAEKTVDIADPFELGSGYDFPKPFADHIKETTGEDLHVEHKLSLWAPAGAFALVLPFLGLAAFIGAGPFKRGGFLESLAGPVGGISLMVLFVAFLIIMFQKESTAHIGEVNVIDKYRKGEQHWQMWVFFASEIIFFAALIGVSWAIRQNAPDWPVASDVLGVPFTGVLTFVLITSSFFMAKAVEAIRHDNQEDLKKYLLLTIAGVAVFLIGQAIEYSQLFSHGEVSLAADAGLKLFSSTFYLQTGFHGLHVLTALIFLIFVYMRARKGGYSKENHQYVEMMGLYVHLVDLVWIILFTVVYLI